MASTPHWTEWNTNSTSTTGTRTDINWKAIDDSTTAWSASPIVAANPGRSMVKLQALVYDSGSWNNLSAFAYSASTNGNVGGSVTLYGNTVSGFTAPASTTSYDALMVSTTPGINANFTTGYANEWTAGTSTIAGSSTQPVVAQALRTQLLVASTAPPGDITWSGAATTVGITATWTES